VTDKTPSDKKSVAVGIGIKLDKPDILINFETCRRPFLLNFDVSRPGVARVIRSRSR
jgi:hypothetical protein